MRDARSFSFAPDSHSRVHFIAQSNQSVGARFPNRCTKQRTVEGVPDDILVGFVLPRSSILGMEFAFFKVLPTANGSFLSIHGIS
jgi:hypothetical protein